MYQNLLYPRVTRLFRSLGNRYQCQFREHGKEDFQTDCAFKDLETATCFSSFVVRFLDQVVEGQVLDSKTQEVAFSCKRMVAVPPDKHWRVREIPAEYAQLAMNGFDVLVVQKATAKRKRKVDETFAKLRQLHDELNAQLYAMPTERPVIHSPADAANILQFFIGSLDHEELWVVNLDTRNRVMNLTALYKGSVNQSQVRVAEVFRQAIVDNSPAILMAHNHPSSDPSPSPDDIALTRAVVQAGKLLDIECLDHLVIAGAKFISLKERGLGF